MARGGVGEDQQVDLIDRLPHDSGDEDGKPSSGQSAMGHLRTDGKGPDSADKRDRPQAQEHCQDSDPHPENGFYIESPSREPERCDHRGKCRLRAEMAEDDGETDVAEATPDVGGQDPCHQEYGPGRYEWHEVVQTWRVQDVLGQQVPEGGHQQPRGRRLRRRRRGGPSPRSPSGRGQDGRYRPPPRPRAARRRSGPSGRASSRPWRPSSPGSSRRGRRAPAFSRAAAR